MLKNQIPTIESQNKKNTVIYCPDTSGETPVKCLIKVNNSKLIIQID